MSETDVCLGLVQLVYFNINIEFIDNTMNWTRTKVFYFIVFLF
jgi:hypothetical protein